MKRFFGSLLSKFIFKSLQVNLKSISVNNITVTSSDRSLLLSRYNIKILMCIMILFVISCSSAPKKEVQTDNFRTLSNIEFNTQEYDTTTRTQLAGQIVTNGSIYKQQGRYSDAIVEYLEALRWDTSSSIYFAIAESYWAIGKSLSAIDYANKSIKLDSTFIPAYELLFTIYSSERMFKEAYTVADQILLLDPTRDNKIRYAILKGIEDSKESIKLLEEILTDSSDTELMLLLAGAYEQNGSVDKKIIILERVHKDQLSNFEIAFELVFHYSLKGDLVNTFRVIDESEKFFEPLQLVSIYNTIGVNLLTLEPESNENIIKEYINRIDDRFYLEWITLSLSGRLAANIFDSINVDKFYDRALTLCDTSSYLYIDASIAYSNLKNNQKSIEFLKIGKEKFPDDIRFDFYLSNAYMLEKDYQNAKIYGKNAYNSDSNNVLFISSLAAILQELKEYDESDRLYEKSIELDPLDPLTNNNYAYSLSIRGENLRKALKLSQLSLDKEPDNSAYLDTYGWINYHLGKYDTALVYIKKAIDIGEKSSELYEHLGDVYLKLSNKELAMDAYLKSLEFDSNSEAIKKKIEFLSD